MIDTPKLSYPFRFNAAGSQAIVVEQNSQDEIIDCVEVLLSTELGERQEVPDYGVPDQTFRQGGASTEAIEEAIRTWEPRADVDIERTDTDLDDLVDRLRLGIKRRGDA